MIRSTDTTHSGVRSQSRAHRLIFRELIVHFLTDLQALFSGLLDRWEAGSQRQVFRQKQDVQTRWSGALGRISLGYSKKKVNLVFDDESEMAAPYIPPPTPGPGAKPKRRPMAIVALVALVVLCVVAVVALVKMQFLTDKPAEEDANAAEQPEDRKIAAVPVEGGSTPPEGPMIEPLDFGDDDDENKITVTIETTPPGAEVFRDGESIGTTPIDSAFTAAEVETWQIFMDGYEVEELTVALDADFHSEIVLKELPPERTEEKPKVAASDGGKTERSGSGGGEGSGKSSRKDKKKKPKEKDGGRTVINSTTGIDLPD